jgi:GrpB-like predicted nucleotidyltransferase (UPF0157 family)
MEHGPALRRSPNRPDRPPDDEPVLLVDYDPGWADRFREVADALRNALGAAAERIDHVGSTAVPGLIAKPIVDIQISIRAFEPESAYSAPLRMLGFELLPDPGERAHRFFRRPEERPRRVNIHVCQSDSSWERRHLLFRDYLRADKDARTAYAQIKQAAAQQYGENRYDYTDVKGPFIRSAETAAERWAAETGWSPAPSDA